MNRFEQMLFTYLFGAGKEIWCNICRIWEQWDVCEEASQIIMLYWVKLGLWLYELKEEEGVNKTKMIKSERLREHQYSRCLKYKRAEWNRECNVDEM